jgi:membrane fusion protein (multidrug efflux system)
VQLGRRVEAGAPLFSIADRGSAWVEANFKEDQLRHMRPGQPVAIRSDLYGEDLELRGRVASIGAGTGSVFAILPPQNATGNWIKIVQRVPVRIELEQAFSAEHPLPFGASLHVEVDTHRRDGPRLAATPERREADASAAYAYQSEGADELIAGIVRANGG